MILLAVLFYLYTKTCCWIEYLQQEKRILCCIGCDVLEPSSKQTVSFFLSAWNCAMCFLMSLDMTLKLTQIMSHLGCLQTSHRSASGLSVAQEHEALTGTLVSYTQQDQPGHSQIFFVCVFFLNVGATEWCWLCRQRIPITITEQVPLSGSKGILHIRKMYKFVSIQGT